LGSSKGVSCTIPGTGQRNRDLELADQSSFLSSVAQLWQTLHLEDHTLLSPHTQHRGSLQRKLSWSLLSKGFSHEQCPSSWLLRSKMNNLPTGLLSTTPTPRRLTTLLKMEAWKCAQSPNWLGLHARFTAFLYVKPLAELLGPRSADAKSSGFWWWVPPCPAFSSMRSTTRLSQTSYQ
jgi:hypothetical protein